MKSNNLSLLSCIGIIVSGCIGSAIFSLSGLTMYYAGGACIISWLIAAVIQGVYGAGVSDLSLHYKESGGVYVFPSLTFGRIWGFISSWGFVVANIIAIGFSAIYIGIYLGISIPNFNNMRTELAIFFIILCGLANMLNIKNTGKFNMFLLVILAGLMLMYTVVAFAHRNFSFANLKPFFYGAKGSTGFISSIPIAMVAYGSVVSIAFIAENVDNPSKNIPLSLFVGLGIVVFLYISMIVSTLGHINYEYMKNDFGSVFTPMFSASSHSMSDVKFLPYIVSFSAFLALITTMLVVGQITAITMQKMAQDGTIPKIFAKKNSNGSAYISIFFCVCASSLLSLKPKYIETLVNLGSLVSAITMLLIIASIIKLQQKNTYIKENRIIKNRFIAYILAAVIFSCYIPDILKGNKWMWIYTLAIYAVGIVVFYVSNTKKNNNF